jgi:hypothetical protein
MLAQQIEQVGLDRGLDRDGLPIELEIDRDLSHGLCLALQAAGFGQNPGDENAGQLAPIPGRAVNVVDRLDLADGRLGGPGNRLGREGLAAQDGLPLTAPAGAVALTAMRTRRSFAHQPGRGVDHGQVSLAPADLVPAEPAASVGRKISSSSPGDHRSARR